MYQLINNVILVLNFIKFTDKSKKSFDKMNDLIKLNLMQILSIILIIANVNFFRLFYLGDQCH